MIKYNIPEPCHEDWNKMTTNAKGVFCGSCKKNVIDFTKLSDFEVLNYLNENIQNQICGRLEVKQLERINLFIDTNILYSNISFWKKILAIILICFGSMMISCNNYEQVRKQIQPFDFGSSEILNTKYKKVSTSEISLQPNKINLKKIEQFYSGVIVNPEPPVSMIAGGIGVYKEVVIIDTFKNIQNNSDTLNICTDSSSLKIDSSILYSYSKK